MATLYIVNAPVGDPDDLTLRARRTLEEVAQIIAVDPDAAQELLAHCGIGLSPKDLPNVSQLLQMLTLGDVAMLCDGRAFGPAGDAAKLIRDVAKGGVWVVPIPGPVLPVTALVLSGLPTDSFVYLGELPSESLEVEALLAAVAREPRTLLVEAAPAALSGTLDRLQDLLGDRPLAVVTAEPATGLRVWRGSLEQALADVEYLPKGGACILVLGGAREAPARWEESQLRAQVQAYLCQGWGIKEISQQLTHESGWSRRQIYALAVDVRKKR
jgi:16S rRNA (cytidine1402-2'-O)-methyltransferase